MPEEEQEHLDRFPLAEPSRRNRRSNQGGGDAKGGTFRFPVLKTRNKEPGLALESEHVGKHGSLRGVAGARGVRGAHHRRGGGYYAHQPRHRALTINYGTAATTDDDDDTAAVCV